LGYRRLEILLQREGWQVNHKRVYRLDVEEKLSLWRKRGQKRSTVRQPLPVAVAANVWSVDFMTDALSSGRRFRTLNIVDDYRMDYSWSTAAGTRGLTSFVKMSKVVR
jgi:putative transposase